MNLKRWYEVLGCWSCYNGTIIFVIIEFWASLGIKGFLLNVFLVSLLFLVFTILFKWYYLTFSFSLCSIQFVFVYNLPFRVCRFLCLVGLAKMGERDRLDGTSRNQLAFSFYWARSHLAESLYDQYMHSCPVVSGCTLWRPYNHTESCECVWRKHYQVNPLSIS